MEVPAVVLVALVSACATLLGTWLTFRRSKSSLKQQIDTQIDRRVTEELKRAYDEIDGLKVQQVHLAERSQKRDRAIGNVLQALAAQWPVGTPRPVLNPRDLAVLDEVIPPVWRDRKETS